jgi:SAM-dependent methyltransferase
MYVSEESVMGALEPDYDREPSRRAAWVAPRDVHDTVGPELGGRVLDVGCGEGRLVRTLAAGVQWFGVDSSPQQLTRCSCRPIIRADMRGLPFADGCFDAVVHLWCLYHLEDPRVAISEARRVLRPGGRYYAATAARNNDPELVPEGYPPGTFDAEDALSIVTSVFPNADAQTWDGRFFPLETTHEVRNYCRHNFIPVERAENAQVPLWLTKRGVLIRAAKS